MKRRGWNASPRRVPPRALRSALSGRVLHRLQTPDRTPAASIVWKRARRSKFLEAVAVFRNNLSRRIAQLPGRQALEPGSQGRPVIIFNGADQLRKLIASASSRSDVSPPVDLREL